MDRPPGDLPKASESSKTPRIVINVAKEDQEHAQRDLRTEISEGTSQVVDDPSTHANNNLQKLRKLSGQVLQGLNGDLPSSVHPTDSTPGFGKGTATRPQNPDHKSAVRSQALHGTRPRAMNESVSSLSPAPVFAFRDKNRASAATVRQAESSSSSSSKRPSVSSASTSRYSTHPRVTAANTNYVGDYDPSLPVNIHYDEPPFPERHSELDQQLIAYMHRRRARRFTQIDTAEEAGGTSMALHGKFPGDRASSNKRIRISPLERLKSGLGYSWALQGISCAKILHQSQPSDSIVFDFDAFITLDRDQADHACGKGTDDHGLHSQLPHTNTVVRCPPLHLCYKDDASSDDMQEVAQANTLELSRYLASLMKVTDASNAQVSTDDPVPKRTLELRAYIWHRNNADWRRYCRPAFLARIPVFPHNTGSACCVFVPHDECRPVQAPYAETVMEAGEWHKGARVEIQVLHAKIRAHEDEMQRKLNEYLDMKEDLADMNDTLKSMGNDFALDTKNNAILEIGNNLTQEELSIYTHLLDERSSLEKFFNTPRDVGTTVQDFKVFRDKLIALLYLPTGIFLKVGLTDLIAGRFDNPADRCRYITWSQVQPDYYYPVPGATKRRFKGKGMREVAEEVKEVIEEVTDPANAWKMFVEDMRGEHNGRQRTLHIALHVAGVEDPTLLRDEPARPAPAASPHSQAELQARRSRHLSWWEQRKQVEEWEQERELKKRESEKLELKKRELEKREVEKGEVEKRELKKR